MTLQKIKQCPYCKIWFSPKDIIEDLTIVPIGMKLNDEDVSLNFFFFNHLNPECMTTFTIHVDEFQPFIKEQILDKNNAGKKTCEHHCTSLDDKSPCGQECHWAPYRRFMTSLMKEKQEARKEKTDFII